MLGGPSLPGRRKYPLQSYELESPHSFGANGGSTASEVDSSKV